MGHFRIDRLTTPLVDSAINAIMPRVDHLRTDAPQYQLQPGTQTQLRRVLFNIRTSRNPNRIFIISYAIMCHYAMCELG
jgi:hypothetical protein